jgi:hypothetical protein
VARCSVRSMGGAGGWLGAPEWTVDAAKLRDTLDRLRAGLAHPLRLQGTSETLVHDKAAIASSLRTILERLDAADLRGAQALSGLVREFQPQQQVERLRDLLGSLQSAWRRHVADFLGEKKIRLLVRLLSSPTPDVLRILGREDDENSHSDLIAWLLTPHRAPVVAPAALHGLVEKLALPDEWVAKIDRTVAKQLVSVRREVVMAREYADDRDNLKRIDIVISGPDFVLAIENKVWTVEHGDQTTAYWAWMEPMTCLRGGLFLSPSGLTASCSDFKAVSYLELVSLLLAGPAENDITAAEEIVLASYLKTLARHILPIEMRAVREAAAAMEAT